MPEINVLGVNLIAVIAAAIAGWIFGSIWYSKRWMGKRWMKAAGVSEKQIKGASMTLHLFPLGFGLLTAAILAFVVYRAQGPFAPSSYSISLGVAFLMWLGFVLPTQLVGHRYQMKPWMLTFIDSGQSLGALIVQGFVLALVGV